MVYLDYAAATPVDDRVLAAMRPYWQERFYNPSALYTDARAIHQDVQAARRRCAAVLHVQPGEIYFTAGATEANNLAISGTMRHCPGTTMVTTVLEHDSVRRPAHAYAEAREAEVQSEGLVSAEDIVSLIREDTILISVEYVSGEIGVVQPLRDIARAVSDIRAERRQHGNDVPLYLHTDASQAIGALSPHLSDLGVDMATINGAKIYGPKQSGILYVRKGVELEPLIYGGGQERGLRAGTENPAFAVGIATALEMAESMRADECARLRPLQKRLLDQAEQMGGMLNGSRKYRVVSNLNLSFPGVDGETLVHHLDAKGVQAATGAACKTGTGAPNHVLVALGYDEARVNGSLRVTMGRQTTEKDISYAASVLQDRLPKLRQN